MRLIKPNRINDGDLIGIVAPSFWMEKKENYLLALKRLEKEGFKTKSSMEIFKKYYYSTDTPQKRANAINKMFADKKIKAIICLDGGCGSVEVIDRLDYDLIKKNPKIFSGFSDITYLNLAILEKSHLCTFNGMDIINGFGEPNKKIYKKNKDFFIKCISNNKIIGKFPGLSSNNFIKPGKGRGVLIGGWLDSIVLLNNSNYFPKSKNIILFWETTDIELNQINSYLNILKTSGLFEKVKGMVIGKVDGLFEKEYHDCFKTFKQIVLDVTKDYNFPIVINADFGHGTNHLSLPLGLNTEVDSHNKTVEILENATN